MSKKKVLYLITQSKWGGAQKYVYDLATSLPKENYETVVGAGGNDTLLKELQSCGIKTHGIKNLIRPINPWADFLAYFEIKKIISAEKPDIIHLNSSKAGVLGSLAARRLKIPKIVYTIHGSVFEADFNGFSRLIFQYVEKISAKWKDSIITISQYDYNMWLKHKIAPKEKLSLIYNGIRLNSDYVPKNEARNKIGNILGKNIENNTIIGAIAHLYGEKGIEYLIKAASPIIKKNAKTIFIVIGEGPERLKLENLIKKCGIEENFLLIGKLKNAQNLLKAFDVFTLPSIKEGFPYVILEAMAAGIPIVCTNVGSIPDVIQHRISGMIVAPNNIQELVDAISELCSDKLLGSNLSSSAKEKVKNFSIQNMIAKTNELYTV